MFQRKAGEAFEAMAKAHQPLLEKFHPDAVIRMLDALPRNQQFDVYIKEVEDYWAAIKRDFGPEELDVFQRLTMLRLIADYDRRAKAAPIVYNEAIGKGFERHFDRIIAMAQDFTPGACPTEGYDFRIDLALCRQKTIPTIFAFLDPFQGYPRTLAFRNGVRQFFEVLWFAIRYGHDDFLEAHLHPADRYYMNKDNFHRIQLIVVDILNANPELKGYMGKGFFADPELIKISPHLAYVRTEQTGAGWFFDRIQGPDEGALTSRKRRELYERGEYIPKVYYGIWPRSKVMKWAVNFHQDHPDFDPTPNYTSRPQG
jgi:hypothetical protein